MQANYSKGGKMQKRSSRDRSNQHTTETRQSEIDDSEEVRMAGKQFMKKNAHTPRSEDEMHIGTGDIFLEGCS